MAESPATRDVPAEAIQVLQTFLDAGLRHDTPAMAACVTRATLESGKLDASAGPDGLTFAMAPARWEEQRVVIPVKGIPIGAPADSAPALEMDCLMVQEDGQWKFDLGATMERMFGGSLGAIAEQLASTMTTVMEGVGQAMAEGLRGAFGEESKPAETDQPTWDNAPLAPLPDELLPLAAMTPLPKTSAAVSAAIGSDEPIVVQVALDDMIGPGDNEQRDAVIAWFEDQLLNGWAGMLGALESDVPGLLKNRLRAVRIEAAAMPRRRFLAVDGSDLVYRAFINDTSGYFGDDEVKSMLPGVLAGLPETIDPAVAGHRLLPTDTETPPVSLYRDRVAPRYMRRISGLLGHGVGLEVNWDAADAGDLGRQLWVWGLARICGAVAMARLDPDWREKRTAKLNRIKLSVGHDVRQTFALYDSGTLEVSLDYYEDAQPGCYELEIAQLLVVAP